MKALISNSFGSLRLFFFFNDTATTEIYTLSLHDALPISRAPLTDWAHHSPMLRPFTLTARDRKSTRLNSSHTVISYAVFCLKQKNQNATIYRLKEKNKIYNNVYDQ